MKKFLSVLLSVLLVVTVFAVPVSALTWEDNQTMDGENYVFDNAYGYVFNIKAVNGKIAGEDNVVITNATAFNSSNPNWAISVLLAPTPEANVYEVALAPVVTPGSASAAIAKGINFDNGNIVLIAHSSYSNPNGANWQSKLAACALKVGDKVTLADIDLAAGVSNNGTVTVQDAPVAEVVMEEITVDGDLSDNGWAAYGWTEVTPDNGYWQSIPTTDTLSYKYQFRTDDTKLYAAFEVDCALVEGGNGAGTNIRFWINSDDEATVYTHFYDVFKKDGKVAYNAKVNTSKTENKAANIEGSSIDAVITSEGDKTYAEFSIDLAEFNGAEGFNYFICVSNKINENVCLYTPVVLEGETRLANLPYQKWYAEGQATVDVEEIKLGEYVEPEAPEVTVEDEMKEALGKAPADAKVDYVIEAPEYYVAGDVVTVTVNVKNITAEDGIHVVLFKLCYDNKKLTLINDLDEKDDNVVQCIKTMPSSWENFTNVANDYKEGSAEGTEVKPLNDGVINVSVFTADTTADCAAVQDDEIVLEFTFRAAKDASGELGFVISNATAEAAYNVENGTTVYEANGSYAVVAFDENGKPVEPDEPEIPDVPDEPVVSGANIALGKPYTTNEQFRQGGREVGWGYDPNAPISYPDTDGKELTDGKLPADDAEYTAEEWAAWTATHPTAYEKGYNYITIDLGEKYDLSKFVLWYGTSALSNGIGASNMTVEVYVSDNGIDWVQAGETAIPADNASVVNECVVIEDNVSAQYVEFRTVRGGWVFLSEAEVYTAVAEQPDEPEIPDEKVVIGIDRVNNYDWTTKDFASDTYTPTAASAGEILMATSLNGETVAQRIGGNWFTWWYKVLAEDNGNGAYKVIATDAPSSTAYESWKIASNQFVILCNTGYASTEPAGNAEDAANLAALVSGDMLYLNVDIATLQDASGALTDVYVQVNGDFETDEPEVSLEEILKEALGEAFEDAMLDFDIEAPETYKAGDEITVTVTVKNILAENGIHAINFALLYDNENLVLTNDLDEEDDNAVICIKNLPDGWENLTHVANDYNPEKGEVEVNPINDGVIYVNVFTAYVENTDAVTEDGALVLEFTFRALEDSEGDIGLVIPHAEAEGAFNGEAGAIIYNANGDYAVIRRDDSTGPVEPDDPENSLEEILKEALGDAFEDAMLDFDIEAPETYKAGDEITVTVTVKNILAENGIHAINFALLYDNENLVLTNDLNEEDDNAVICIKNLPNGWENLTHVNNDFNPDNAEGTEVKPINDGVIFVNVFTANVANSDAITEDGDLVLEFTFKAIDDAEGDTGFVIPHAEAEGAFNGEAGAIIYNANGDYALVKYDDGEEEHKHTEVVAEGKDPTCDEDGLTEGIYCEECGEWIVEQEVIPALGHDFKPTVTEPTCTDKGYTTYVCHCGETYVDDYVDALGHDDGEWVVAVEAAVGKEGLKELRCTVCGEVLDTEVIPALYMLGDVNNNGEIEKYDYIYVKRAVMQTITLTEEQQKAADVNGSGEVDKYDYIFIKRHVMGTLKIEG